MMPTPLLVITSDIPFGELIRQRLEETGRFVVRVTGEQEAAGVYAREFNPALAFLDTSLTETDLLKIGALLRQANPGIIFVVISEAGWHSALEELFPREYLSKPFYLPDLLEMMDKFFRSSTSLGNPSLKKKVGSNNDLPWLLDVTRAAQHLTRLTLESSAQAALITRADQLWAYAGQLPQSAARELADTLSRYWDHQEENDLVRFVRLASTNAEHMLYATRLAEGMVLALVFDAETPFSTIRTQASQLVHSLSTSPSEEPLDEELTGSETDLNPLSDRLSGSPAPNPLTDLPVGSGYDFGPAVPGSRKESSLAVPMQSAGSPHFQRDSSPAPRYNPLVDTDQTETPPASFEDTVQSPADTRKNKTRKTDLSPESIKDTSLRSITEVGRKIVLEPVSPAVYNLDYACLLVPRFPHHHMTGDLLDRLGEWVPQICIAFALRLEYISVRPEYLQWIVNVPPATSPAYLMRILRQHTSENIFAEFPRFKKDNPSGDFWAPGYLIMGGSQPPPAQLIKDFIAQTRQRQGFSQQINR
ncbi:MAG: transposase [Chloroflexi bacterium]|nr:transposase [Chloroflexota bacterium]